MHIWVDADACPVVIKEILFRAAERKQVPLTLVANRPLRVPPSPYIHTVQVITGFDVADNWIAHQAQPDDLVVTADIPLAAQIIALGAHALNPRGEFYDENNIRERLNMRDFMETLRGSGMEISGPATLGPRDRQAFAAQLDRFMARRPRA